MTEFKTQKNKFFPRKGKKHVGKRKNAGLQHFLYFHTMFSKGIFLKSFPNNKF